MADPISISATAIAIAATTGRLYNSVNDFRKQVREARRELDDLSRELGSLKLALEALADEAKKPGVTLPPHLPDIIQNCESVIERLESELKKHNSERLATKIRYVWSGRNTIDGIRDHLAAHQRAIDLAVDVMTLSLTRQMNNTTNEVLDNTEALQSISERILDEIRRLRVPQPQDDTMLERYLEELTAYAGSVVEENEEIMTIPSSESMPHSSQPQSVRHRMNGGYASALFRSAGSPNITSISPSSLTVTDTVQREDFENMSPETLTQRTAREKFVASLKCVPSPESASTSNPWQRAHDGSILISESMTPQNISLLRSLTMSGTGVTHLHCSNRRESTTPLHAALAIRDADWLDRLLEMKVNCNETGRNPCSIGVEVPRSKDFRPRSLYRAKLKEWLFLGLEKSALQLALDWNLGTARRLVDAGAIPVKKELECIARRNWKDMIGFKRAEAEHLLALMAQFLINCGARQDQCELAIPIKYDHLSMVRVFLENGWEPNARWEVSEDKARNGLLVAARSSGIPLYGSVLNASIRFRKFDIAKVLIDAGADLDEKRPEFLYWGETLLPIFATRDVSARKLAVKYDKERILGEEVHKK